MSVRVGVIGAGAIAATHMELIRSARDVALRAVFDVEFEQASAFARRFDMMAYRSLPELWSQVDAVYITAPNRFHAELTLAALAQRKHVFCEKPFALSLEEAHSIREAALASGCVYQLGFNRRCAPAYRKIKQFMAEGSLRPTSFNIKMNRGELQRPVWTSDAQVTGGFLFESSLHLLDTVRFLFGDVKEVRALGSKSVYPCVDNFSILLAMESGVHGVFSSCAHTTWSFPFERVEVYGEHATIFNDEMEAVTFCTQLDTAVTAEKFATLPLAERWGYTLENRLFIDRLSGREVPRDLYADANDGYANVALIERIYDEIGLGK